MFRTLLAIAVLLMIASATVASACDPLTDAEVLALAGPKTCSYGGFFDVLPRQVDIPIVSDARQAPDAQLASGTTRTATRDALPALRTARTGAHGDDTTLPPVTVAAYPEGYALGGSTIVVGR
jgi:hypothetical protein